MTFKSVYDYKYMYVGLTLVCYSIECVGVLYVMLYAVSIYVALWVTCSLAECLLVQCIW